MADPIPYRDPRTKVARSGIEFPFTRTKAVERGAVTDLAQMQPGAERAGTAFRAGLATIPAAVGDVVAPIAGAVQEQIVDPVARFGKALFGIGPGQEGGQPPEGAPPIAGQPTPGLPVIPEQAPLSGDAKFRREHEEFLRTQQPRSIRGPGFKTRAKPARSPLEGIGLPQLSGNVGLGDLMKFRLGLLQAGTQLVPRVAEAAAARTERETAETEAGLGLKALELGQREDIARSAAATKREGFATTLESARIRAAGTPPGMADIMKDVEAGQQFEEMFPLSAPDLQGNTVSSVSRQLADVYPADAVLRVARQLQDQSAQAGEVDLSTPENATAFNTRLAQTLDQMYPNRLPKRPQQ